MRQITLRLMGLYLLLMCASCVATEAHSDTPPSAMQPLWLKLSQVSGHWQLRRAYYAPARLKPTAWRLQVVDAAGVRVLALSSVVLSDFPDFNEGPFFVEVGEQALVSACLQRVSPPPQMPDFPCWSAAELR